MTDAWLEIVAKAAVYAGTMGALGAEALLWLLVPRVRRAAPSADWPPYEAAIDRVVVMAACIVLLGLGLRVWAHTVVAFGYAESWSQLGVVGLESRWGSGWRIQVGAATALLAAAALARSRRRPWRALSGLSAVALGAALTLTGHAAGDPFRTSVHALHVLGAGLWIGTLAVVMAERSPEARRVQPHLLKAFAPVAMAGSALLVVSGTIAMWSYLGPFTNFWQTTYGRLLVVKLGLVGSVAVLGGLNWRALHRADAPAVDRWRVAVELMLAAAVVLLTAWLTETQHHV